MRPLIWANTGVSSRLSALSILKPVASNTMIFTEKSHWGPGGFYRYALSEHRTDVYLGTRLLMLRRDETGHETTSMNRLHRTDSEYRGYQTSMLAGVDYYFSDAFSIGGEVGLEYTDVDVTFTNTMMGRDKTSSSDTRTRSNLIARYYF